jgi:hypothetical protein
MDKDKNNKNWVSNDVLMPIYNREDIHSLYGKKPRKNKKGLLDGIEMVLFPGSSIWIEKRLEGGVYQIKTPHYPVDFPIYVDERRLNFSTKGRQFFLPAFEEVLNTIKNVPDGTRYVYGGNVLGGIDSLYRDFPVIEELNEDEKKDYTLNGLDCSGLFFYACRGATMRNCSMLDQVGSILVNTRVKDLKPLDLILTKGHVAIVESSSTIVESALRFEGVRRSCLNEELLNSKVFKGHRIVRPFFEKFEVACRFF